MGFLGSDLIEPYWNVKGVIADLREEIHADLIEPYWNVKNDFIVSFDKKLKDLIEPYWNVKGTRMPQFGDFSNGFNRTILECKVCSSL